jgi:hypothetical protein
VKLSQKAFRLYELAVTSDRREDADEAQGQNIMIDDNGTAELVLSF